MEIQMKDKSDENPRLQNFTPLTDENHLACDNSSPLIQENPTVKNKTWDFEENHSSTS